MARPPKAKQDSREPQPIGDRDVELALQQFYRLTPEQQLRAFDEERRFPLAAGENLDRSADELAERAEALRVMGEVAEHLDLPDGTAPNGPQFRHGLAELGLASEWSERRVREAFIRWRFAVDAYEGRRRRLTPAQRAYRERVRTRAHRDYFAGVRAWLTSGPPPVATGVETYDA